MISSPYFFPLRVDHLYPRSTLYIFHYSGGGASSFRPLVKDFDSGINVIGVQLPGRENRFQESCIEDLDTVIHDLIKAFRSYMDFLGHSMGARMAFECVQAIWLHDISLLKHLIISGRRVPHRPNSDILRFNLTNKEMITVLKKYGVLNDVLLTDKEVLSFLLSLMHSGFKLLEQFQPKVTLSLTLPITAIGDAQDQLVLEEDLQAWKGYTIGDFKCQMSDVGWWAFFLAKRLTETSCAVNQCDCNAGCLAFFNMGRQFLCFYFIYYRDV
jgi:medium-chain acyl-[acyl-carrier-protein] hydrolase